MDHKTVNSWKEKAPLKPILWTVGVLTLFVAFTFVLSCFFYGNLGEITRFERFGKHNEAFSKAQAPEGGAMPRLQVNEYQDLLAYKAKESEYLDRFEWLNEADKVIRVPIDIAIEVRAMMLQAEGE